ncbi:peptidoglycan DD-metalloendopeptidase family protein [Accumulibacter sp.]|uniref:peptidoglycan DD-metalloendopeptidase family protein n=1 Tax=Accumulibacter sp. TaxID=2053492 RepID=UPI0026028A81|nr:peptidoglycan DD-metalloendopeptidase family protein [Accumulibacter sp.]
MKDQWLFTRPGLMLTLALLLAGCAGQTPVPMIERGGQVATPSAATAIVGKDGYLVKKGDTLYSIALDQGVDYRDLVAWNALENPNRILVGQVLRVKAPGAVPSADTATVRPVVTASPVEQRSLDGAGQTLKREPKAGKEPYSDQALARAQAAAQQKPAEAVAAVSPVAKVDAKPEAKPEAKPAVRAESRPEAQPEVPAGEVAAGNEEIVWAWPASGKLIGTFSEGGNKGIDIAGKAGDPVLAASGGKVVYSGTGLRGYGKLVIIKHNNNYVTAYAHNQNVLVKEGQSVNKGQKIAEMGNTDADQVKLHFEVRRQVKPVDPLKYLPPR